MVNLKHIISLCVSHLFSLLDKVLQNSSRIKNQLVCRFGTKSVVFCSKSQINNILISIHVNASLKIDPIYSLLFEQNICNMIFQDKISLNLLSFHVNVLSSVNDFTNLTFLIFTKNYCPQIHTMCISIKNGFKSRMFLSCSTFYL